MSYAITLTSLALKDLREVRKWYDNKNPGLSSRFEIIVNKQIEYLCKYPSHYQIKYKNLRQSKVETFPYSIFYLLEEHKKRIVIIGVLRTSRNPDIVNDRA